MNNNGLLILKNCLASIQDCGRLNLSAYGIPVSGHMDQLSAWKANRILGNPIENPLIEIFYTGFKCSFKCDIFIAVTGAAKNVLINGEKFSSQYIHKIQKGDEVEIKELKEGFISYLSISKTFGIEKILGSYSTNTVSNFGGFKGRFLQKGDFIPIIENNTVTKVKSSTESSSQFTDPIRIIEGPEYFLLSDKSKVDFISQKFIVQKESNRMGYRLSGVNLFLFENTELPSSVTIPGTIQLTNNHQLIVIMKDGQTTGGYSRVGTVIAADLDRFAQYKTGDLISFNKISYHQAIDLYKDYLKQFETKKPLI
jgi:antagonist of KipI